jgi:hypothetical protein
MSSRFRIARKAKAARRTEPPARTEPPKRSRTERRDTKLSPREAGEASGYRVDHQSVQ